MGYLDRLAALDPLDSLLTPAEVRLLLLTGQSSFASASLRQEQSAFLHGVAPQRDAVLDAGFPYHRAMLANAPPPALGTASLRNALQVLWSLSSERYQSAIRETLQRALDTTRGRLLLVTGSCGLQMANRVWLHLAIPPHLQVRIVALGPACFGHLRLAPAAVTVLQGDRDGWSRLFYRGRVDVRSPCGHLDYWTSAAVKEQVAALLR